MNPRTSETGISRREFIRKAAVGAAAVGAVAMGMSRTARAVNPPVGEGEPNPDQDNIVKDGSGGWIVYPTGDGTDIGPNPLLSTATNPIRMTRDSRNIQWAMVNVDTSVTPQPQVLLKAATKPAAGMESVPMYFNFQLFTGTNAVSVKVWKDVVIVGESMPEPYRGAFPGGEAPEVLPDRAMIYGGKNVIICNPSPPGPSVAPKIAVRNVYFAYPCLGAVRTKFASGFEVSHCTIYDITAGDSETYTVPPTPGVPGSGIPFRYAVPIEVTGLRIVTPGQLPNPYLNGDCVIANNFIKRKTEGTVTDYGFVDSGAVVQLANMNANISGNEIHGFPFGGIGIDSNTGSTNITNNLVFNCAFGGYIHPKLPTPQNPAGGIAVRRNTAPLLIDSNQVTCGYEDGHKKKTLYGITLAGVTGGVVRSNTIVGMVGQNESGAERGLNLTTYTSGGVTWYSRSNSVLGNNLKGLLASTAQVFLDVGCHSNQLKNNDYGPVGSLFEEEDGTMMFHHGMAGTVVRGSNFNTFVNENFWGEYPGTMDAQGNAVSPPTPCMWFTAGSTGNTVSALKNGQALQGFDICTQIFNAVNPQFNMYNNVNGYAKCGAVPDAVVVAMVKKEADFVAREKARCYESGGAWDDLTQTCTIVEL